MKPLITKEEVDENWRLKMLRNQSDRTRMNIKMEENTIYRLSEITVNADELRRIREELDEHLASALQLWRRLDNLIKQGTIPTKHDTNTTAKER